MINRASNGAAPPKPNATRFGQGRFARAQTGDPLPRQNTDISTQLAAPSQDRRPQTRNPDRNQLASIATPHPNSDVSDPPAQPYSP